MRPGAALRGLSIVLFAVLLAAPPPDASAAPTEGWTTLVEDGRFDARWDAEGYPVNPAHEADLASVEIAEERGAFWIRVTPRDEELAPATPSGGLPLVLSPDAQGAQEPTSLIEMTLVRAADGSHHPLRIEVRDALVLVTIDGRSRAYAQLAEGESASHYALRIDRSDLLPRPIEIGDALVDPWAMVEQTGPTGVSSDRGPNSGFGARYTFSLPGPFDGGLPSWAHTEADDYAAGPSLAVDAQGVAHVAYIVYNGDRGVEPGLYHGTFDATRIATGEPPGWRRERVAEARMPTQLHEHRNTQTAIAAADGRTWIAFAPYPNTDRDLLRVATDSSGTWTLEDPTAGNGPGDDDHRAVPSIVAGHGRVVLAYQSGDDVLMVERTAAGTWSPIHRIEDARFPRVALGPDGRAHVSWLGDESPSGSVLLGTLRYASEAAGWRERDIASEVIDQSVFWNTSAVDGAFAFALDPEGQAQFVWQTQREPPAFGRLGGDDVLVERAPLVPDHGNPQLRMRMAVDAQGRAHVVSGYGALDMYAIRTAEGMWAKASMWPMTGEMADLAFAPDGRVILVKTQPHGGTTLAFATQAHVAGSPSSSAPLVEAGGSVAAASSSGPALRLAAVAAAGGAVAWGVLAAIRTMPRRWRLVAALVAYTRLSRPALADQRVRRIILDAARSTPGVSAHELRAREGIARSTLYYHLRRLEAERLLVVETSGKRLLLSLPGARLTPIDALVPADREILRAIEARPGLTTTECARVTGLPRRTVSDRLAALEAKGLLAGTSRPLRPRRWNRG